MAGGGRMPKPLKNLKAGIEKYELANSYRDDRQASESIFFYDTAIQLLAAARINLQGCMYFDRAIAHDLCGDLDKGMADFQSALAKFCQFLDAEPNDPVAANFATLAQQTKEQIKARENISANRSNYTQAINPTCWNHDAMPISVYIDESATSGFAENFRELIWRQATQWFSKNVLTATLEHDAEQANVIVRRIVDPNLVPLNAGARTIYEQDNGALTKVEVLILCNSPNADDLNFQQMRNMSVLILHEFGHACGLDGHSPFGNDVMYWKSQSEKLSSRDVETLALAYEHRSV